MSNTALRDRLVAGLDALELSLTETQIAKLLDYIELFAKWNQAYNLSAIHDPDAIVSRHVLDSLSVAGYLRGKTIVDVGTGGGLPGIPLAIVFPDKQFTLLDSNGKKTRFLFQVKTTLQLANVAIENKRAEDFSPLQGFDVIISRAFASIATMIDSCQHLLAEGGNFYAMKGQLPSDELATIEEPFTAKAVVKLHAPGNEGERHLIVIG